MERRGRRRGFGFTYGAVVYLLPQQLAVPAEADSAAVRRPAPSASCCASATAQRSSRR
ncbi:hypothetical protein ACETU7_01915 [Rhodococcus sp. 3Y1]